MKQDFEACSLSSISPHRGASYELAGRLRDAIADGDLRAGTKLPTVRQLMKDTSLGYATVLRSLSLLAREGLVVQRRGAGTFVARMPRDTSRLSTRSRRIGVVVPGWRESTAGYRIGDMIQGVAEYASRKGHSVRLFADTQDQAGEYSYLSADVVNGQDGFVWIHPRREHEMNLARLLDRNLPVVCIGRPPDRVPVPTLFPGHRATGRVIAEYMRAHGLRHLIVACPSLDDSHVRRRLDGLRAELVRRGLTLHSEQICAAGPNNFATARQCVTSNDRFDLVFALDMDLLNAILTRAGERGRFCPRDFRVIASAAIAPVHELYAEAPIIAYVAPADILGQRAARILEQQWGLSPKRKMNEIEPILIEPRWRRA